MKKLVSAAVGIAVILVVFASAASACHTTVNGVGACGKVTYTVTNSEAANPATFAYSLFSTGVTGPVASGAGVVLDAGGTTTLAVAVPAGSYWLEVTTTWASGEVHHVGRADQGLVTSSGPCPVATAPPTTVPPTTIAVPVTTVPQVAVTVPVTTTAVPVTTMPAAPTTTITATPVAAPVVLAYTGNGRSAGLALAGLVVLVVGFWLVKESKRVGRG